MSASRGAWLLCKKGLPQAVEVILGELDDQDRVPRSSADAAALLAGHDRIRLLSAVCFLPLIKAVSPHNASLSILKGVVEKSFLPESFSRRSFQCLRLRIDRVIAAEALCFSALRSPSSLAAMATVGLQRRGTQPHQH